MTNHSDQTATLSKADSTAFGALLKFLRLLAIWVVLGFVVGFGLAYFDISFGGFLDRMFGRLPDWSASVWWAVSVSIFYVAIGLFCLAGLLVPRWGISMFEMEDRAEWEAERSLYGYSVIDTIAWGGALLCLAFAEMLGGTLALALFVALMAIGLAAFYRQCRVMDELFWDMSKDASAIAYYLILISIGGWAVLAHLGLIGPPAMLDIVTLFWALMLVASVLATAKRGMLDQTAD